MRSLFFVFVGVELWGELRSIDEYPVGEGGDVDVEEEETETAWELISMELWL